MNHVANYYLMSPKGIYIYTYVYTYVFTPQDHLLARLAEKFPGDSYDLVRRNCNHFANELCVCLTGKKVPSYINRPANVGRYALNIFSAPALAIGKLVDGVKKTARKDERGAAIGETKDGQMVVPAPSAAAIVAASQAPGAASDAQVDAGEEAGALRRRPIELPPSMRALANYPDNAPLAEEAESTTPRGAAPARPVQTLFQM